MLKSVPVKVILEPELDVIVFLDIEVINGVLLGSIVKVHGVVHE